MGRYPSDQRELKKKTNKAHHNKIELLHYIYHINHAGYAQLTTRVKKLLMFLRYY